MKAEAHKVSSKSEELRTLLPLPDRPMVTIKPNRSWAALDLRSLWAYRELFYFLTWRNVKVRYEQAVLGVFWAVAQPLVLMLIFTLFLGRVVGLSSENIPYALFAYSGFLLWLFFSNAVTTGANSMVEDAELISKVYFPRMAVPAAAVGTALIDFAVASVVLVGMMVYFGVGLSWNMLMLPMIVVLTMLLSFGTGMWLSALNVKYRDVRYAVPFLVQVSLFASPVIYPASLLPQKLQWIYAVNPLAGLVEGFRAALFGSQFNWATLSISTAVTLVLLVYFAYSFRRLETQIADII